MEGDNYIFAFVPLEQTINLERRGLLTRPIVDASRLADENVTLPFAKRSASDRVTQSHAITVIDAIASINEQTRP